MSCVIDGEKSKIVRDKGEWVVDGKFRVKDLSECKFKEGINETRIVVHAAEAKVVGEGTPKITKEVSAPVGGATPPALTSVVETAQPPASVQQQKESLTMEPTDEMGQLLKLAGDNAWLVAAVLLFTLGKRYLDMKQQSDKDMKIELESKDKKIREDLGGECQTRHGGALTSVLDLKSKLTDLDRDTKANHEKARQEIEVIRKDIEEVKRKMYESELAAKYLTRSYEDEEEDAPRRGRPKKQTPQ